jgi:hypothetical protein
MPARPLGSRLARSEEHNTNLGIHCPQTSAKNVRRSQVYILHPPSKIAWICSVLFVRIRTFQGVTRNPNKKNPSLPRALCEASQAPSISSFLLSQPPAHQGAQVDPVIENMVRRPSEFVNRMLSNSKRRRRGAGARGARHNRDSRFLFRLKATPNRQPTKRRAAHRGPRRASLEPSTHLPRGPGIRCVMQVTAKSQARR